MPEVILPCPACGSTWVMTNTSPSGADIVQCCNCYMHGPLCDTEEYATERWNTLPRMSTIIACQLQAAGAVLENQRLKAILQDILDNDGGETGFNAFELDKFRQQARAAIGGV